VSLRWRREGVVSNHDSAGRNGPQAPAVPLLEALQLRRWYGSRGLVRRSRVRIRAVDGVDLSLPAGTALGLVGESGSGKSTLARLLLALERPDQGAVRLDGVEISALPERRVRPLRRRFQAVFQDPYASLNPRLRIGTIIAEPLLAHGLGTAAERRWRVGKLLDMVGLPVSAASRLPAAFSGGERQRIAIARALATEPDLLVLDEPVSSLDVSVKAQVLDLLTGLREELGLTLLLISHDLTVVGHTCDRIAVMYRGVLVEQGPAGAVLTQPWHPYTAALLAAASAPDSVPDLPGPEARADGPAWPSGACRFAPRCPLAHRKCAAEPGLEEVGAGHQVACWAAHS